MSTKGKSTVNSIFLLNFPCRNDTVREIAKPWNCSDVLFLLIQDKLGDGPRNGWWLGHSNASLPRRRRLLIVGIHHARQREHGRNYVIFVHVLSVPGKSLSKKCMPLQLGSSGPPSTNPACTCYPFTSFLGNRKYSVPAQKHHIPCMPVD